MTTAAAHQIGRPTPKPVKEADTQNHRTGQEERKKLFTNKQTSPPARTEDRFCVERQARFLPPRTTLLHAL